MEFNHKKINRFTKTRYLVFNINENPSWQDQYEGVKATVKSDLSAILKLKDILPQSKLAAAYQELIESHLIYVNISWGFISVSVSVFIIFKFTTYNLQSQQYKQIT